MGVFAMSCSLPESVLRGGGRYAAPRMRYALPQSIRREETVPGRAAHAYALGSSGIACRPPSAQPRGGAVALASRDVGRIRVALPMAVSRDATIAPGAAAPGAGGTRFPEPRSGSEPPAVAAAPRDRTSLPIESLFPIVRRVARGISGAAGYGYMGEEPDGAGLRYGLLGLRLDTGDMGAALALARDRDGAGFPAALGGAAEELLATATAADPAARLAPVAGTPLWAEPWKSILSRAAMRDAFRAAQNEYAIEGLLAPAADLVLAEPGLASGTGLALALDVMAELGRDAGLAALGSALGHAPATPAALAAALARACPRCRLRLEDLARDPDLAGWRPARDREGA